MPRETQPLKSTRLLTGEWVGIQPETFSYSGKKHSFSQVGYNKEYTLVCRAVDFWSQYETNISSQLVYHFM